MKIQINRADPLSLRARARGFTLLEIAVVLVVIGILAAGALVASKAVMDRSRVAQLQTNIKDLAVASREFKTRYNYFPGDLPNASTYITSNGGIAAPCIYGTGVAFAGDGVVNTVVESNCALDHLVKAGMLSKVDFAAAANRYVISSNIVPGVEVSLWFNGLTNENMVRVVGLPCDVALELDRKLDSATAAVTPFSQGSVVAQDAVGTQIANCIPAGAVGGPLNDPVPTLLIKY